MRLWPLCFALTRTAHVATFGQVFDKPFDAPAILVVGHQTDGKSGECDSNSAFSCHGIPEPCVWEG